MHSTLLVSNQTQNPVNIRSFFNDEIMVNSTNLFKTVKKLRFQEPEFDSIGSKKTALSLHNNLNNEEQSNKSFRKNTAHTQASDDESEESLTVAGKKMNISQNLFQIKKSNIRSVSNQPKANTAFNKQLGQENSYSKDCNSHHNDQEECKEVQSDAEESATIQNKKNNIYQRPNSQFRRRTVNLTSGESSMQLKPILQLNLKSETSIRLKPAVPKFSQKKKMNDTLKICSEQQIANTEDILQRPQTASNKDVTKKAKTFNLALYKKQQKLKQKQQDQVDKKDMLKKIQDINYDIYLRNSSENYVFTRHAIPKQQIQHCKFCGKDTLSKYQFLVQEILDGACCSSCFSQNYLKCSCCKKPNEFIDRVYQGQKISRYSFRINWRMQHNKLYCKNCYIENRCQCKECLNRYKYLVRPKTSGATTSTNQNNEKNQ